LYGEEVIYWYLMILYLLELFAVTGIIFEIMMKHTRDSIKVILPVFFFRKHNFSNNEIYMDDSYIICNYDAIFSHSLCHFQYTFASVK
jgi:hypothetical protein